MSRSVVPSRTSSRTTDQISLRLRGSSPVVGSSKNSTRGRVSRLDARSRRRRIPPEYVRAGRSAASASSKRSSSSFARRRASAAERSNRRPNIWRFSRPVRISSTAANWPVSPNSSRTPAASWTTSRPNTSARPASGASSVASTRTRVVFPAPFGPTAQRPWPPRRPGRPQQAPWSSRKRLTTPSTWTAESDTTHSPWSWRTRAPRLGNLRSRPAPGVFRACSPLARGAGSAERPSHPERRGARRRQARGVLELT